MADEIDVFASLTFEKDKITGSVSFSDGFTLDVAGSKYRQGTQTVGTTDEVLDLGDDFGTPGWVFFRNNDATNFLEIGNFDGASTYVYTIKLKGSVNPREFFLGRLGLANDRIALKANTAPVELEFLVIED